MVLYRMKIYSAYAEYVSQFNTKCVEIINTNNVIPYGTFNFNGKQLFQLFIDCGESPPLKKYMIKELRIIDEIDNGLELLFGEPKMKENAIYQAVIEYKKQEEAKTGGKPRKNKTRKTI